MKVVNHTSSKISLPSGHTILPRQIKAMNPDVINDPANKLLVKELTRLKRLTVETGAQEVEQFRARIAPAASRPDSKKKKTEKIERLSASPSRQEICFATKDALVLFGRDLGLSETDLLALNEEDCRLFVAARYFDDPVLSEDV